MADSHPIDTHDDALARIVAQARVCEGVPLATLNRLPRGTLAKLLARELAAELAALKDDAAGYPDTHPPRDRRGKPIVDHAL